MGRLLTALPAPLVQSIPNRADLARFLLPPRPFYLYSAAHFAPNAAPPVIHAHPCACLHGCLHGPIELLSSAGDFHLEPGMFCWIGADVPHGWRNPGRGMATTFGLWLDTRSAGAWQTLGGPLPAPLRERTAGVQLFDVRGDAELHAIFWQLSDHLLEERSRPLLTTTGLLLTLVGLLLERLEQHKSRPQPGEAAQRIHRLLQSQVGAAPTVAQIARAAGLSRRQAERAYRECYGQGILGAFNELKIARAKRLLGDPTRTIDQVSRALGFGSPSYFSRAFHRHTGSTPTEFRQGRTIHGSGTAAQDRL